MKLLSVFLPLMAGAALGAPVVPPTRHEVTSLPGMPADQKLPSRMFSGFVDAGTPPSGNGTMYMHYVMFEAENNPKTAPTLFWYNGGPGASSMFGIFQELGPLYLNVNSEATAEYNKTGIPTPLYNPYTWSKNFNLFALDSPAPVGYSYCTEEGPAGDGFSCGNWTDTAVFKANHQAITGIMNDIFPEFKKNELYISGESYAGIYVPGIAGAILDEPKGVNLKGYAVGDGCMGDKVGCQGPIYDVQFFGGHGQFSNELYRDILAGCSEKDLCSGDLSKECRALLAEMKTEIGGYYVYDLYDDCPSNEFSFIQELKHKHKGHGRTLISPFTGALNDYACSGTAMNTWLNLDDVKTAMGVPVNDFFFNEDNGGGFNYKGDIDDIRPYHIKAAKAGLRILSYEGDSDACGLNSEGFLQEAYVDMWPAAGYERTEKWRPWTVEGSEGQRMGGYAMEWDKGRLSWISIRGSGHLVPLNKPAQAATMINSFVLGKEYPHYTPK